MSIKIENTSNPMVFRLNGLLRIKGNYEIEYGNTNEIGIRNKYNHIDLINPVHYSKWIDGDNVAYTSVSQLEEEIGNLISVDLLTTNEWGDNKLAIDAWGKPKVILDKSIFHGMFTYNIPKSVWVEHLNGIELSAFSKATSLNGKLNLTSGNTLNDEIYLHTFRKPRYEPNRGYLYSTSVFLPSPTSVGIRRWGYFTKESGAFFELTATGLYAVVRTTIDNITTDDRYLLDTTEVDLSKGQLYDIQMQWRGVGNYKFFLGQRLLKNILYEGTRTNLTMFNPANPLGFECINLGANVVIQAGCVDVTSEGGENNGKTYGSVGISNQAGQVPITGFNAPIIAIKSLQTVNNKVNTRDTLALLVSAYADQRALLRIWQTRDMSAITPNNQVWKNFGDGHLQYIEYDNPDVTTPMSFNTAKAQLVFGCRIDMDQTYTSSALFEGRASVYLHPNDMFVFTLHRETGAAMNGGVTFEFAEEI